MRRQLPAIIAAAVLLGLLTLAATFTVQAWQRFPDHMGARGWVALVLGGVSSIVIGCGLMALMFYGSRTGRDDQPKASDFHREVP